MRAIGTFLLSITRISERNLSENHLFTQGTAWFLIDLTGVLKKIHPRKG